MRAFLLSFGAIAFSRNDAVENEFALTLTLSPDILTRFAPLNHDRAVGRVAPRAPPRCLTTQNGAHGVRLS